MQNSARTLIERLTRWMVFPRRLPEPFEAARMFVTPAARLGYAFQPFRKSEPDLLRCAATLVSPGDTVWDVGANIGVFAFSAAARAGTSGRVFAFEPDLRMAELLRRSAGLQPPIVAPVTVVPVALGSAVALRSFSVARRASASNALAEYGQTQMGGIARTETVPAVTLDWLLTQLAPPHLIKIDVEGAELEVLSGQRETLERIRPIIICEVGAPNADGVTELLRAAGYELFDADRPLQGGNAIMRAAWNTVAVPKEKTGILAP
jgi:FkbM family methyltransferase